VNVVFKVSMDKNGLLEMETAELSDENFQKLRGILFQTKRIVIDTKTKFLGSTLCATIDDDYQLDMPSSDESGDKDE